MRLQTKISLTVLPLAAISIIFMGVWSVIAVKESIGDTFQQLMVQELEDFVDHTVQRYYTVLKKNQLDTIDSFVKNYQEKVYDHAKEFHFIESGNLVIMNTSGQVLKQAAHKKKLNSREYRAIAKEIAENESNYQIGHITTPLMDQIYVGYFFEPWDWILIYAISHDVIHAAQNKVKNKAIALGAVCLILMSVLIGIAFRFFFVRPVKYLQKTAQMIAEFKDIAHINIHSKDEIGALARSMESMASSIKTYKAKQDNWQLFLESEIKRNTTNLKKTNKALGNEIDIKKAIEANLRQSEERFKAIFESTTDCIIVWDKQYNYLYANQAAIDHVGVKRENVIGKNIREGLGHLPQFMRLWMNRVDDIFNTGESVRVEDSIVVGDKIVYSESVLSPILDPKGNIFAVGVVYRDVTKRKFMEQRISETLDLNQKIIFASSLGILVYDNNGNCLLTNDAACEIVGATQEQVLAQNFNLIPSWKKSGLTKTANAVVNDGTPRQFEMKSLSSFKKAVWLDIRLTQFMLTGKSHLLLILDDVLERKQLEEQIKSSLKEKEILLKEIHHRVKNNLQVVSSILKMQSNKIDDKQSIEVFKESQDRITSMALVHEQLYRSDNLAAIDFGDYIKELTHSLQYSFGNNRIHINIEISDLFLGVDTAIPCGLIINELITNAFKYAFLPDEKGEIFISFCLTEENKANLVVKDTGKGMPKDFDLEETKTLGMKLVYNLITHQLDGDIRIISGPGTTFEISFPYSDQKEKQRIST